MSAVHNHGPEEGRGLACNEQMIDGRLVGACMNERQESVCNELCVMGSEILPGAPLGSVAYAHPDCEKHATRDGAT